LYFRFIAQHPSCSSAAGMDHVLGVCPRNHFFLDQTQ
jgi:hypothetical protein